MRSEWVHVSAAALVTGVMALVLGQLLNPGGSDSSPAGQMIVAAEHPGRWLAMGVLFFTAASAMVLGMPAVMTLFQERRGRGVGIFGVAVFTVGCVGIGALSGLMLMFRALALRVQDQAAVTNEIKMVTASLEDPGLVVSLGVWVYGFLLGVLLLAIGLFRSRRTPTWAPLLMVAFLVLQALNPLLGEGPVARMAAALGLMLLAAGFTGVAIAAASSHHDGAMRQSLV